MYYTYQEFSEIQMYTILVMPSIVEPNKDHAHDHSWVQQMR